MSGAGVRLLTVMYHAAMPKHRITISEKGEKQSGMSIFDKIKRLIVGGSSESDPILQPQSWPIDKTVGELQGAPMLAWGNDDVIVGLRFVATMQLRTPLRVLRRHGEMHSKRNEPPPHICHESWEGIWIPETRLSTHIPSSMASQIGPIPSDGGDYLPFLLQVREVLECYDTIEERLSKLKVLAKSPEWRNHPGFRNGIDEIANRFFPLFLSSIPHLSAVSIEELRRLCLNTPNRLAAASDENLLEVKGIGKVILKNIRKRCEEVTENRDKDRLDVVIR